MSSTRFVAVVFGNRRKAVKCDMGDLENVRDALRRRFDITGEFRLRARVDNESEEYDIDYDEDLHDLLTAQEISILIVPVPAPEREVAVLFGTRRRRLFFNDGGGVDALTDKIRRRFGISEQKELHLVAYPNNSDTYGGLDIKDDNDLLQALQFPNLIIVAAETLEIFVEFAGTRRKIKLLLNRMTYKVLDNEIRNSFRIKAEERVHLVAYYDNTGEWDIQNDRDVTAALVDAAPTVIRVYPGGPYTIWLGKEKHSITCIPPSDTCLVRTAREVVLPNFKKTEFVKNLHILLHSIKLAQYRLLMTDDQLSIDLSNMANDALKPAIVRCTETFRTVVEKNKIVLDKITVVINHLRDGLEHLVKSHLEEICSQADGMEKESEERVKDLEAVEDKIREILLKVQAKIVSDVAPNLYEDVLKYLKETSSAIRKVQSVMSEMRGFWSNVKTAIGSLRCSTFMTDITESVAGPAAAVADTQAEDERKRKARHLWRTMKFKLTGISFISRHAAIRDICLDCHRPMVDLQDQLREFLEEYIPDRAAAQAKYDEIMGVEELPGDEEAEEGELNLYDPETIAEVRKALDMPYESTLRQMTQALNETGYADLPVSTEAEPMEIQYTRPHQAFSRT